MADVTVVACDGGGNDSRGRVCDDDHLFDLYAVIVPLRALGAVDESA